MFQATHLLMHKSSMNPWRLMKVVKQALLVVSLLLY